MQTVLYLIRRRVLWRLIGVYTICQRPFCEMLGVNGLKEKKLLPKGYCFLLKWKYFFRNEFDFVVPHQNSVVYRYLKLIQTRYFGLKYQYFNIKGIEICRKTANETNIVLSLV